MHRPVRDPTSWSWGQGHAQKGWAPCAAGHHVLLGAVQARSEHRVLPETATRESPYTENGPARAATTPAAAGSEALLAAFIVLVLLCFGGSGIFWLLP